jgi:hypothetical protein
MPAPGSGREESACSPTRSSTCLALILIKENQTPAGAARPLKSLKKLAPDRWF